MILPLDGHTVNCMHGNHFQREDTKLISNNITRFDKHIHQVITDIKDPTKSDKWKISASVTLKYIVSGNQHRLPLTPMKNLHS